MNNLSISCFLLIPLHYNIFFDFFGLKLFGVGKDNKHLLLQGQHF